MTAHSPGAVVAHEFTSDPATMTPGELRRQVRLHRQRITALVELYDRLIDEKRLLREEVRHLRAENQRLVRLAREYQQQAGMAPAGEGP